MRERTPSQVLLFVCGGNTGRSPMAESIARAELMTAPAAGIGGDIAVGSAGVNAHPPRAPIAAEAAEALRRLGVPVRRHRSRQLTAEMCRNSTAVYCMTRGQRAAVVALAPDVNARIFRLDQDGDVPDPAGQTVADYLDCALRLRRLVCARLREHLERASAYATIPAPASSLEEGV